MRQRIEEAVNIKRAIQKENDNIRMLRLRRYRREKANMEVNFVANNVNQCETYDRMIAMKRMETVKVRQARTQIYKHKRQEEEEARLLYNVLSLNKWEFLREKRAEYEGMVAERIRNRR